jgi:hypothetical protein
MPAPVFGDPVEGGQLDLAICLTDSRVVAARARLAALPAFSSARRLSMAPYRPRGPAAPRALRRRDVDAVEDVGHRHRKQRIHQRHDADREGVSALRRRPAAGSGSSVRAACRAWWPSAAAANSFDRAARRAVQQDLQPALQLAAAQHHQRLAHRFDARRAPAAGVFTRRSRFRLISASRLTPLRSPDVVGVRVDQLEQAQHHQFGRRDLLAAQDDRTRKIIALEIFETRAPGTAEFLERLDLFGQQFLAWGRARRASAGSAAAATPLRSILMTSTSRSACAPRRNGRSRRRART